MGKPGWLLLLLLLVVVLLVHHPGRYLVATVVVNWSVARLLLLLLLLLLLPLGLLGTDGGRNWTLLGGVDVGVVINLKLGHCKDRENNTHTHEKSSKK